MKKVISYIMVILCSIPVIAEEYEATFYANPVTVAAGETATVTVSMKNNFEVTALAFWIDLPKGLSIAEEMNEDDEMAPVVILSSRKKSDHMLFFNETVSGGMQISCLSGGLKTFRDNDGEIMTIKLKADKDVELGEYNIHISHISFSDIKGNSCIQEAFDIPIIVTKQNDIHNIDINVSDDNIIYNINGAKVTNEPNSGIYISRNRKYVRNR